jgi:hypothetical protein
MVPDLCHGHVTEKNGRFARAHYSIALGLMRRACLQCDQSQVPMSAARGRRACADARARPGRAGARAARRRTPASRGTSCACATRRAGRCPLRGCGRSCPSRSWRAWRRPARYPNPNPSPDHGGYGDRPMRPAAPHRAPARGRPAPTRGRCARAEGWGWERATALGCCTVASVSAMQAAPTSGPRGAHKQAGQQY